MKVGQRLRLRPAEIATVASGLFVAASALLPAAAAFREEIFATAGAVIGFAVVWYRILPRGAFGEWRYEIGGSLIQIIAGFLLVMTGGIASYWFGFYMLPLFATVFSYRPRATLIVAGVATVGLIAVGLALPGAAGSADATRDVVLLRALELATVASMGYLITRAMRSHRQGLLAREDQLREALEMTEREARTDALTGTQNRRSLEQALSAVTSRAERDGRPYGILIVDVDGLKALNDRSGHVVGDTILRLVSRAAMDAVRSYDVVARYGGDEFIVVLHDTTAESAQRTGERIQQRFDELLRSRPEVGGETISMGAATWRPGKTPSELIAEADEAMYAAKRARGRGSRAARTTVAAEARHR